MNVSLEIAPEHISSAPGAKVRAYSYQHTVSFEETNLVGNVYFTRHLSWQGRCRELFLRDYAASVLDELRGDLRLVTLNVSCTYFAELHALDRVEVQMRLAQLNQHRITLRFDYLLNGAGTTSLAAQGSQDIGCMRQTAAGLVPTAVPKALALALAEFEDTGAGRFHLSRD